MTAKYKKKSVFVDAFQMTEERRCDNRDWPNWMNEAWNNPNGTSGALWPADFPNSDGTDELIIGTLERNMRVPFGHWIIRGEFGEFYTCDPELFELLYEPITA